MPPNPTDEHGQPNSPTTSPPPPHPPGTKPPDTTPAQEHGERMDTGKAIARGGKTEGEVPGAQPDE